MRKKSVTVSDPLPLIKTNNRNMQADLEKITIYYIINGEAKGSVIFLQTKDPYHNLDFFSRHNESNLAVVSDDVMELDVDEYFNVLTLTDLAPEEMTEADDEDEGMVNISIFKWLPDRLLGSHMYIDASEETLAPVISKLNP